jgi:hypothetical protein
LSHLRRPSALVGHNKKRDCPRARPAAAYSEVRVMDDAAFAWVSPDEYDRAPSKPSGEHKHYRPQYANRH